MPAPVLRSAPGPRLFAPTSIWNQPVDTAPVDPSSSRLVQALAAEATREQAARIGPWINHEPSLRVGRTQPTVRVALDVAAEYGRTLQQAFAQVPLPDDARPGVDSDHELSLWQPSTDRLWDFWRLRRTPAGTWRAAWGGAMSRVSQNPGWFGRGVWPGAQDDWGATASGFPVEAGMIHPEELKRGHIDHALAVALPAPRSHCRALPAQRTDGTDPGPDAIPEGARLRLDPKLDVSRLGLPRATEIIARAAQRYGMVVRDKTDHAIAFFASSPAAPRADPYPLLFDGLSPRLLLEGFPWARLQVVNMDLRCA